MYKFEMHLHTSACSGCARYTIEENIDYCKGLGYDGFVVTNHFYHGNSCVDRSLSNRDFIKAYADDYYNGLEYGKSKEFTVLFGIEEVYEPGKEMLIYGIDPEVFLDNPDFVDMSGKEKSDFVRSKGGICVCAHPFRDREYIPQPNKIPDLSMFDGIEVYNNANSSEENVKAFLLAANNPEKIITSAGDVHYFEQINNTGMLFFEKINNNKDLIKQLKSGSYKLLSPHNI